jgi:hypothetical protein
MAFTLSERVKNLDVASLPTKTYLSEVFEEEPVSLDTFLSDKKFMGVEWKLSPIQEQAVKHIERVYLPELYPLMAEEFGGYWEEQILMKNLMALQWGKGSGKDHVCRVASLRVAYLLLCLKSPQVHFGMPEHDSIHMLNIAVNARQAERAFFKPLVRYVKKGWFADKAQTTRDTIEYDKNLLAISGHSDAESQEGLNLILGVADEIDAFKAQNEMVGLGNKAREASTSAESILKMLKGSASTRFPYSYKRVTISYPRYLGSTIQKETDKAYADIAKYGDANSIYFASGPHATWEVNPLRKGKDDFLSDYRENPDEAASMYECKPTRATDAYFRNPIIFQQAVDRETQPIQVDYVLKDIKSKTTGATVTGWEPRYTFDPDFKPIAGARYALHGDLAVRGDKAGIAMSHIEKWDERISTVENEDGSHEEVSTTVPIIRNDFTFGFAADIGATPPREIQIRWARMLAFELHKRGFYIARFTFDGFQSTDTIQILNMHGIESEKVSADRTDEVWKTLKDVASDSRLKMPFDQLLMNELEGLSRVDGKVDHPPGGSKDLADAFACSVTGAIVAGGEEDPNGEELVVGDQTFVAGSQLSELSYETNYDAFSGALSLPRSMKGMKSDGYY